MSPTIKWVRNVQWNFELNLRFFHDNNIVHVMYNTYVFFNLILIFCKIAINNAYKNKIYNEHYNYTRWFSFNRINPIHHWHYFKCFLLGFINFCRKYEFNYGFKDSRVIYAKADQSDCHGRVNEERLNVNGLPEFNWIINMIYNKSFFFVHVEEIQQYVWPRKYL